MAVKCSACGETRTRHAVARSEYSPVAPQMVGGIATALIFALEPVFAGIFGFALAGDRLGVVGWAGCAVILAGIAVAEPAAARTLSRIVRVRRAA